MPALPQPISHTVDVIYAALIAKARSGDSRGVPMSDVANDCDRAIWYKLRWAAPPEPATGPQQRRFGTGLREEERLLDDLEAAGIQVERLDPATGRQFQVALADGWLRGRMDGRAVGLPEAPKTQHVVECKSHNDRSFKDVCKKGLKAAKPEHFAQCQAYMHAEGLTRCLYLAVNKNTDDLYAERIEYNFEFGARLETRIGRIVTTDKAPPRLHDDPAAKAAFACGWCPARAQCHEGALARRNCRTCLSAELKAGAEVWCGLRGTKLSYDQQQAGCAAHLYLPDLVPGEQVDASERDRSVTYRLPSGEVWIDGQGRAG